MSPFHYAPSRPPWWERVATWLAIGIGAVVAVLAILAVIR